MKYMNEAEQEGFRINLEKWFRVEALTERLMECMTTSEIHEIISDEIKRLKNVWTDLITPLAPNERDDRYERVKNLKAEMRDEINALYQFRVGCLNNLKEQYLRQNLIDRYCKVTEESENETDLLGDIEALKALKERLEA